MSAREREQRRVEFALLSAKCREKRNRKKLDNVFSLAPTSPNTATTNPKKLTCLSEAFDLFDTDGSGAIDAKELTVAMR